MKLNMDYSFNDFYYFYLVVKYSGFSAASEATLISKSKLSRHIVELEKNFNVQLIQRTTRYFKVTPIGQELYEECCKIINQVQVAENVLRRQTTEPEGIIRIAAVPFILQSHLRQLLNNFLKQYPKIQIEFEVTQRHINPLHDNVDIVIGSHFDLREHPQLVVHNLCKLDHCLVVSPDLLKHHIINQPTDLYHLPCISLALQNTQHFWNLTHCKSREFLHFPIQPRIIINDFSGAYCAAKDGLGVANLPYIMVEKDIKNKQLVQLLPQWHLTESTLQLAYLEKKGCRLAVEKLVTTLLNDFHHSSPQLDYMP